MTAAIARVRKTSAQTAHWSVSDSEAGALNVFSATLCGRPMVLGEWSEVHDGTGWSRTIGHGPAFLLQPCQRCAAKLSKIRDEAHAEAIAEDVRLTGCVCTDRDGFGHTCAGYPNGTPVGDVIAEETSAPEPWIVASTGEAHLIFLVNGAVRADTGAKITQARTVCGLSVTGETSATRPPFLSLCLDCVEHDAQNGGSAPAWEDQEIGTGRIPEETSAPTLPPDAYVIANYEHGELSARHIVARIYGSDSGDSYRPTDGARYSDDPYGDPSQYTGFQGSADTLCGTIAYGVTYAPHQGPAVTCEACQRARRLLRPAEETSAPMPADSVPTTWGESCDYCKRYGRPCGRHDTSAPMPADSVRALMASEGIAEWEATLLADLGIRAIERTDDAPTSVTGGPVDIAVRATAALLGTSEDTAREHLESLHRTVIVDTAAQDVIAAAYDALPEYDEAAEVAWQAFAAETMAQAAVLRSLGLSWGRLPRDPYADTGELFAALRNGTRIDVLSTAATGGHPVLSDTVNDTFRAVHDILGHAATGRGFDRHGEEAAYQAHAALYSPLARQALATETRGQNASMLRAGGVFPPQKIAVLPEWARDVDALKPRRSRYTDEERADMREDAARDHATQGLGEWVGA